MKVIFIEKEKAVPELAEETAQEEPVKQNLQERSTEREGKYNLKLGGGVQYMNTQSISLVFKRL